MYTILTIISMTKKSGFEQYIDPTGEFTNKELAVGDWFVRHKIFLRRLSFGLLIAWCVITIAFSTFVIGEYLFRGLWQDKDTRLRQVADLSSPTATQLFAADPLQEEKIQVFASSPGKYDIHSAFTNENAWYVAYVTYHYEASTGPTEMKEVVVLPGQRAAVSILGIESPKRPSSVKLAIDRIRWERINAHFVSDVPAYVADRLDFMTADTAIGAETEEGTSKITFTLTNETVFDYWHADFLVEMRRGKAIVGVFPLSVPTLRAQEERAIDLRPFVNLDRVTNIRLIPAMDVFDRSIYMPVGS